MRCLRLLLAIVAILIMIGCSISKESPSPIVQKTEACGSGDISRASHAAIQGLVWEAPGLRREGRWYVWASSSARDGAMVGFDGRPRLLGGSEHRAMDAQAIERSRDLPVGVEITG